MVVAPRPLASALAVAGLVVCVACGSDGRALFGEADGGAGDAGDAALDLDGPPSPPPDAGTGPPLNTIAVSGNQLVDQNGKVIRLLGVNFDGGEYMCIQNRGIFDGPSDDALVTAIAKWKVNV